MPTTTNYGWTTPADTDLVKDGASAIRTLGTSIDTTTKNLNPSTTLGDIEYRSSSANTNTRLAIGTTGQILTVAGGVPSWATPAAAGGLTLINTGGTTLTGSSVSITSIPGTYKHLLVVVKDARSSTASIDVIMRFNNDSGSNYAYSAVRNTGTTLAGRSSTSNDGFYDLITTPSATTAKNQGQLEIFIPFYTATDQVGIHYQSYGNNGTSAVNYAGGGVYDGTAAITEISFTAQATYTFSAGTVYVYGVN
jgi:hypothetical protein